jgi:iron complex outermembrane receptor protein
MDYLFTAGATAATFFANAIDTESKIDVVISHKTVLETDAKTNLSYFLGNLQVGEIQRLQC